MELKICHLYPDVMNLSCDGGNVLTMERRLQWRGIEVSVSSVQMGDMLDAAAFDLVFMGNGQPFAQPLLLEDIQKNKAVQLRSAVEDGIPVLAIDGAFELLGRCCETAEGEKIDGLGILAAQTKYTGKRFVGNYLFTCDELKTNLVGFENHSGKTYLDSDCKPLGTVLNGFGNNGEDHTEGARYRNVFATYAHGCLLPKNPVFCDHLLFAALQRKYGTVELEPLDDTLENNAHRYMETRLSSK